MKHEVSVASNPADRWKLENGNIRTCRLRIDGILCVCVITLYRLSGPDTMPSPFDGHTIDNKAYRVKIVDNKEVSKHPDWKEIRKQILSSASKFFAGMSPAYIHRKPADKPSSESGKT